LPRPLGGCEDPSLAQFALACGGRLYAGFCQSLRRGRGRHLSGVAVTGGLVATLARVRRAGVRRPPGVSSRPPAVDRAVLLQVGFTRARVSAERRALLPHDFTLAATLPSGRYVSVALSFELPRQDVILHLARWSPGRSSTLARRDDPASSAFSHPIRKLLTGQVAGDRAVGRDAAEMPKRPNEAAFDQLVDDQRAERSDGETRDVEDRVGEPNRADEDVRRGWRNKPIASPCQR